MAVNEYGYARPTYEELLETRIMKAKELFGDDIDTSNSSPLGKFIRLAVEDLADAYEAQEIIYYNRFPNTATGHSLDRLMPFAGITRTASTRAIHEVRFHCNDAAKEVSAGFLVGTVKDVEFYLVNTVPVVEGVAVGNVECTTAGEIGNVDLGTITEIVNPDVEVLSIEHTNIISLGKDGESDEELRERFLMGIEGSGSGTKSAIRGAVMRVNGVISCTVLENDTDSTNDDGVPAHSFEVYVDAPEYADQEIAEAIFSKKPLGIATHGSKSVKVTDVSGKEKVVYFTHVEAVNIHIEISIAKDADFELDGVGQIKDALVKHINSLGSGEDVIYSSLYKYIFGVAGVRDVTSLKISSDGSSFVTSNISIPTLNTARLDAENIEVEVTDYADS